MGIRAVRTMSDIVLVTWADAHGSQGGWVELDDYKDEGETIISTAGFLINEGEPGGKAGHVSIWQSLQGGEGIHGFHIPVAMVRSMTAWNGVGEMSPDIGLASD